MSATPKAAVPRTIVDMLVDPHWISFAVTPDGVHTANIEFSLVAYDGESRRVNFVDRGFVLKLKPDQYAQIAATGVHVRFPIDIPASKNSLRMAAQDFSAAGLDRWKPP
jgi:hypothetical protein